jgi:hypothetical protein
MLAALKIMILAISRSGRLGLFVPSSKMVACLRERYFKKPGIGPGLLFVCYADDGRCILGLTYINENTFAFCIFGFIVIYGRPIP